MRPSNLPYTADYGTEIFNSHKSVRTVLESGTAELCGRSRRVELYHMTQGYKPSGSAAIWTDEIVGVRWYNDNESTTHGQMYRISDMEKAMEHWTRWNVENRIVNGAICNS